MKCRSRCFLALRWCWDEVSGAATAEDTGTFMKNKSNSNIFKDIYTDLLFTFLLSWKERWRTEYICEKVWRYKSRCFLKSAGPCSVRHRQTSAACASLAGLPLHWRTAALYDSITASVLSWFHSSLFEFARNTVKCHTVKCEV